MSRTVHSKKGAGYEYWTRRPGPITPGRISKKITSSIERARERELLHKELKLPNKKTLDAIIAVKNGDIVIFDNERDFFKGLNTEDNNGFKRYKT